uniref:Uncharacterized protein n=1 Tax=Branchiostoma floridae TaxID=7739 RepID=C3YC91_BRAFL|eukprot:XP_002606113.1 hypothetical protein BRAFLDRAFT_125116 [Branchiostoma floridae]
MQNSSNGPDGEPRGHRMPQPPPLLSQTGTSTAPNHQSTRDGVRHSTSDSNSNLVSSQSVDVVSQQLQTQDVQPVTLPAHINAILSKCMNQEKSRHDMQTSERRFCGYHKNQRNNSVEFFNITVTKCTVGGDAIHCMSDVPLPYDQYILDTDNMSITCDPTTSDYSQYAYDCPEWSQNTRISNHSQVPPDRPAIRQAAARRTGDPELQLIVASLQNSHADTIQNPLDLSRKRELGEEILYKVLEETTSSSATDGDMSNIQVTYDGEGRKEQTQSTGTPEVAFVPESYMYTNTRNTSHAVDLSQNSSKPPTGIQHIPKEIASKPIYRNGSETTNQQSHPSELSYATFARNPHPYETAIRPGSNMMAHVPEPSVPGPSQRQNKTPPGDAGNPYKSSSWPRLHVGPHINPPPGLLSNSKPSHRSHPEVVMRRPPYVPYQQLHLPPQPYPYRHHLNIPYHHPVNQQVHNQRYPPLPLDNFRPTGGYASGRPVYYPHNTTAPSLSVHPTPMWSPSLRGDHADAGPQERHASSTSQERPLMQSWHPISPAQPPSHSVFTPWSELAKLSASQDQWPSQEQPHDSHMKEAFQAQHPTVTHQLSLISVPQSLSLASAIWKKLEQESPSEKPQSESTSSVPQSPSAVPQSPSAVPQSPSAVPQSPPAVPQSPPAVPQSPPEVPQSPPAVPQSPPAVPQSPPAVPQSPSAVPKSPSAVPQSPSAVPQSPSAVLYSPSSVPQPPSENQQSPSSVSQSPSSVPQSPSSAPQSPSSGPQSPSSVPQSPLSFVPSSPLSVQQSPSSILQSPSSVPQSQSSKLPSSDSDDSLPEVEMPHLLALFNSAPIHKEAKLATSKPSLQSKHSDEQNVSSNEETKPRRPTTSHKEAKSATSKPSLQSKHSDEQNDYVSSNEETKPRRQTTSHKEAKSATSKPSLQSKHSDEQNVSSNEETKPRRPTTSHKEAKSATSKPSLQSKHSDEQNVPSNEETKPAETDKNGGSNRAINNLVELRHLLLEHEENTASQTSSSRRPQHIGPYDYNNPQMAYYWDCMQTTLPSPFDKPESIMSPYAGMSTREVRERNQGITQQSPTKRRQEDNPGDSLVLKKRQMTDWLDNLENEGRCELIDTDGENSRGSDVFERVNGWGARQPLLTTTQRQGMETVDNAHKLTISPQPLEELALFTAKMVGPQVMFSLGA